MAAKKSSPAKLKLKSSVSPTHRRDECKTVKGKKIFLSPLHCCLQSKKIFNKEFFLLFVCCVYLTIYLCIYLPGKGRAASKEGDSSPGVSPNRHRDCSPTPGDAMISKSPRNLSIWWLWTEQWKKNGQNAL